MKSGSAPASARVSAAAEYLNRGWGKVTPENRELFERLKQKAVAVSA